MVAIVLKAFADVIGSYLTKTAVDEYLASGAAGSRHTLLNAWLSSTPLVGIAQIAIIYVTAALLLSFALEFVQTYFIQWTGQKAMFDLRSEIFRHLRVTAL